MYKVASGSSPLKILILFAILLARINATQAQREEYVDSYKEQIRIQSDGPLYLTGDRLRFSIMCFDQSNGLFSPLSRLVYVELLDSENVALAQSIIDLENGQGSGDILLPFGANSGNYVLRAYTRWMRNFPPEGYAHSMVTIVNPFKSLGLRESLETSPGSVDYVASPGLAVASSKSVYAPREKAALDLTLKDTNGAPVNGLVSVSVSKVPDFYPAQKMEAKESALKVGPASSPFKVDEPFLPETRGQFLTGKVNEAGTTTPRAKELVYLSIVGKQPEFYTAVTDAEGNLKFEIVDFFGKGEVHLQSRNSESVLDFVLTPVFSDQFATVQVPSLQIDEEWEGYLTQASQNMQIRNVYATAIAYDGNIISSDTLPFYGNPDQRYFLDDYTRFPLMEEVLKEYVSGILPRKKNDEFFFRMVNPDKGVIMENEPLMLYDGLPVEKAGTIMEIDPRQVKRIDVITKRYLMGDVAFDGITSFHSYEGDLKGLNKEVVRGENFTFVGVQPNITHVFPDYENPDTTTGSLPDFRNTLFWSPSTKVNNGQADIAFFTGDDTGTYLVEVEGISQSGEVVTQRAYLKVEK